MEDISKDNCVKLSNKILNDIYKPVNTAKTTIFLCGADIFDKTKNRYKIAEALNSPKYRFQYDIIYPEDIFDELLYSSKTKDLLSLENILAESVDAIVLIPESPGSFTELGVFASNGKLRKKLICIVDNKYRKKKSFINQGPLKLVKKTNKQGLIFIDPYNINAAVERLNLVLRKVKRNSSKKSDVISLLQLDNFLLPSIFLLEPVAKNTLINLVASATKDEENSFQTTTSAITILIKNKLIELTGNGYKLTDLGVENFLAFQKTKSRKKRIAETIAMDNLRLEIFNFINRKCTLRF